MTDQPPETTPTIETTAAPVSAPVIVPAPPRPAQTPSIGRIVHVNRDGKPPYAAIVTAVWSPTCVNLTVFGDGDRWPNGTPGDVASVAMPSVSQGDAPGEWAWPPFVR